MKNFHFKQAGVFHLQRLQYLVLQRTGVRYKLGCEDSLTQLLKIVLNETDAEVGREFARFYLNCWPCTQAYISSELMPKMDIRSRLMAQSFQQAGVA